MRRFGTIFLAKEPRFTASQLDKLSDVFITAGQLFAASMILPFVIPELDKAKLSVIVLGLALTLISWTLSVLIIRKLE